MEDKYMLGLLVSPTKRCDFNKDEVERMKEIIKEAQTNEGAKLEKNLEMHLSMDENSFYAYVCESGNKEMVYVVYAGCRNKDSKESLVNKTISRARKEHTSFGNLLLNEPNENSPYVVEIMNEKTLLTKPYIVPDLMDLYPLLCWTIFEEGQ